MTLALLLTAVTGAWAQDPKVYTSEVDMSVLKVGDILAEGFSLKADKDNKVNLNANRYRISDAPSTSDKELYKSGITVGTNCVLTYNSVDYIPVNEDGKDGNVWVITKITKNYSYIDINISGSGTAETPITVAWTASTKTGTFAMPGSDVVLTPIYAKAATFATTGTEPEVKTLLPEAAEGVIAGTDASLIAEGTGIVAFAGTSTEVTQGTLMYAIGTSATEAPALTAFSATVPTAKDVADDGADVYVWYYIQGADAPDGEAATLDNTFDNTEPACLTVQVLTNKFDIQFNAANANTIEAGKATVTVGGTDKTATVTEGKLEGVKMGSEVKLEAKPGYKFRKVEVKKISTPTLTLTSPEVGQIIGSDGKNYNVADVPTGVTAVAVIAYVGSDTYDATFKNGLAIALADEGSMNWSTAMSTCEGKTAITGAKWCLPSQDQWKQMFKANGGNDASYTGLNTIITTAGGTILPDLAYWSSTPNDETHAYGVLIYSGLVMWSSTESKDKAYQVRACLAF